MFRIVTTSHPTDTTKFVGKGAGKQRTVTGVSMDGMDRRHGLAVGAVLDALCDDRQRAMLRHPSGRSRVHVDATDPVRWVWSINV